MTPAAAPPPPDPGRQVRAVLSAALDAAGLATVSAGRTSAEDRAALGLPEAPKVCLVLVDGLGARQLAERGGHAPFLRRRLTGSRTLHSTVPSTTAAAITAVGTGELPGATGMLGYSLLDPTSPPAAPRWFSLIHWETTLEPRRWQPRATLAEQLAARDGTREAQAVVNVGAARFVGSGLTVCALRGIPAVTAESLADRVDVAAAQLRRPEVRAAYLYWGEVDHVGHAHGWGSRQWGEAVEEVDQELGRLARRLPRGTLLLVTADHGMIDVAERIDVAASPALGRDVRLVAGEERMAHVYTAPGAGEDVARRWREELGERATVLTREELVASGLLGADTARAEAAGDLVALPAGRLGIVDSRTLPAQALTMVGVHGGVTAEEMEVPLIAEVV